MPNMSFDADCNLEQKNHWLYKFSTPVLPSFYLKRGSVKHVKYTLVKNREECIQSSLYLLVFAHTWITKGKQRVSLWSGFCELVSKPELD